ncbi:penicillin-binding protein [Pseudalkalibacillus caeni]|uniref:Penicillin-binding protein n=1 Tax=Exobacillus caeni TaxID=2574798 RepID=A0A5R9EW16_9BACL|nr:penicillin-binding protein [Pseudalkalibacillus caeni]TLS35237.1 penicillin-binding protein [Pseudalkalibacillus caeni]
MKTTKHPHTNRGAVILSLLFVLLFFIFIARFFVIESSQTVKGEEGKPVDLKNLAEEKWTRNRTIEADRGSIVDRTGKKVLAEDIPAYTVIAILDKKYPDHVKDVAKTAQKLAPILDMSETDLKRILSSEGRFQVEFGNVGRNLSLSEKEKIEELDLPGINFIESKKRYYPNGLFASHIIGFTNEDKETGKQKGVMGLEKDLNKYLTEQNGTVTYQGDRRGFELPDPDKVIDPPKKGYDVQLTIDQNIQLYLEQAMSEANKKYSPERMIGIVADPKTGRILAMSNRPSFDPNKRNVENFTNYAISSSYEPGSTMKIFTLAAAIEEGVYNGNEKYQSGTYKYQDGVRPIKDHNGGAGWGKITFDEGVQKSSNVAFSILAKEKLGFDRFKQYLHKFGLDEKTGIDLPGEANSRIRFQWESEKITTAFGQGTAITPIQQIQAATAIANGGKMMRPYVVEKIVNPNSKKIEQNHEPKQAGTPISKETAAHTLDILETVVTEGTGTPYQIPGYDIAGKTGTAQISDSGGYMSGWGKNIFSFLGFAPKDNPKLIVYVAVDRPNVEFPEAGSAPVSQVFKSVMKNSLQYLNIEPQEEKTPENKEKKEVGVELKDFTGEDSKQAEKTLKDKGFEVVVLGNGSTVKGQAPYAGSSVLSGERIVLKTDGEAKMPDLTSWSLADVLKVVDVMDLKPNVMGEGFVTKQGIDPGATVKEEDYLVVQLNPPNNSESEQGGGQDEENEESGSEGADDEITVTD